MIFDKTGTLTIGKPIVVGTKIFTDIRLQVFYDIIAAAEVTSCSFCLSLLNSLRCLVSSSRFMHSIHFLFCWRLDDAMNGPYMWK